MGGKIEVKTGSVERQSDLGSGFRRHWVYQSKL